MLTLPLTKQSKQHEWKTILTVAHNNGFPTHIIHSLQKILKVKKQQQQQKLLTLTAQQNKKWIVFTYHSPLIRKVINLFNPLNPVVVLVPSSLSRQQSGLGTSTNTIFINFFKKKYWEYWLQVCTIRPVHVSSFSGDDLILSNAYTCVVASVIELLRHS